MNRLFVGLLIGFSALTSQAGYLLWFTVTNESQGTAVTDYYNSLKESQGLSSDTTYANVYAVKTDGSSESPIDLGSYGFTSEWQIDDKASVSLSALDDHTKYSYYIEIANSAGIEPEKLATAMGNTAYAALATSITEDDIGVTPPAAVWHGQSGGYRAAPEPTSAMLMLLGVAGLALKRKQKKA